MNDWVQEAHEKYLIEHGWAIPPPVPKPEPHVHEWERYVGLTNTFDYCKVCDEKRPIQ